MRRISLELRTVFGVDPKRLAPVESAVAIPSTLRPRVDVEETKAKVAFEEGVRMLEAQTDRFEGVRARAATIVGVSGIGATFVGARAIDASGKLIYLGALSTALLALAVVFGAWALVPQGGFMFGVSSKGLLEKHATTDNMTAVYEDLADQFERFYDTNQPILEKLTTRYEWSTVGLFFGLIALLGSTVIQP